jgi:hypothetical protein
MRKSVLTPKKRAALSASAFAIPGERKYPIYDLYHGRLALIYVLSPSNSAYRDRVVKAVLARYPELRSFWTEKTTSRRVAANPTEFHPMRHTRHNPYGFEYVENPYGIEVNVPVIRVSGRTSGARALAGGAAARAHFNTGERTHALNPKTGYAMCGAGKGNKGNIHPSDAKLVTCYRCIKVFRLAAGQKAAFAERNIKPSSASKRTKHVMLTGGREGQFVGRREKREGIQYKRGLTGALERSGVFGPADVTNFRRGSDLHPTQTRLAGGKVAARKETARERKAREARAGRVGAYEEMMDNPRRKKSKVKSHGFVVVYLPGHQGRKMAIRDANSVDVQRGEALTYEEAVRSAKLSGAEEVVDQSSRAVGGAKKYMDNPRKGASSRRAAGLAKGQNLMQEAAKAYHAGKYSSMSEALKGVAKKRR